MTVQIEEPGVWIAYCDHCGERKVLDADAESASDEDVIEEIKDLGFTVEPPEKVRFKKGERDSYTEMYARHYCADCSD